MKRKSHERIVASIQADRDMWRSRALKAERTIAAVENVLHPLRWSTTVTDSLWLTIPTDDYAKAAK